MLAFPVRTHAPARAGGKDRRRMHVISRARAELEELKKRGRALACGPVCGPLAFDPTQLDTERGRNS